MASSPIAPESTLQQVLEAFPGARRALFRRYHIGGCSSCGFQPEETLAQLCQRSNLTDPAEVIAHILDSHEQDEKVLMAPAELAEALRCTQPPRILDIRSREEWEAVRIAGSVLLGQELMQEILGRWPRNEMFVVCDHTGKQGLDAAAYFLGHGFSQVRCLRGGIDAWSQEVDPTLRRYSLTA
jgi:rhodanese-related sulfurtransferase